MQQMCKCKGVYEVCEVTRTSNSTYGNIVEIKTDLV